MKPIELRYNTPDGVATAFVFMDDDGLVASEKGLTDLVNTLNALKHGRVSRCVAASDIADFLDLSRPCPRPAWESLRQAYAAEWHAAAGSGCSDCTKTSIAKKFIRVLYDQSRIDAAARSVDASVASLQ